MSFILKALKKVEQEQAARGNGPVDVHSALLHGDGTSAQAAPRLARWGVIALVFIAGSGLTYFLMDKSTEPPLPTEGRPVGPAAQGSALPAPAVTTSPLSGGARTAPATPTARDDAASRQATAPTSLPEPAAVSTSPKRHSAAPDKPARPSISEDAAGSPPPGLKINGIALQDDPAESVAVINGALLKRGMTVEGVQVEEILQDRVRFSGNGGTFEVHLSR
jgi:Type II secretion system protein B